jgi:hypothetical protein
VNCGSATRRAYRLRVALGCHGCDTLNALDEQKRRHCDGFLPLDEVGQIEGNPKAVAEFLKSLSFQVVTGQRQNRASRYEDAVGAIKPDTRVVFGLTAETSLARSTSSSAFVGRRFG